MARKIVGRNQQEEIRRLYPKTAYSRWISLQIYAPADDLGFNYTEMVGQRCWLLAVKVKCIAKVVVDPMKTSAFWITTGTEIPTSHSEVANWENVLPVLNWQRVRGVWNLWDGMTGFDWEMEMLYLGHTRRFAVALQRVGAPSEILQVSFKISEG
ncbi:hypothetical protein ES703_85550 [subsurface metagenome]